MCIRDRKKAADDIHTLFEKGYMSEYAPANYPEGQNEIGFGESCMILNASWIPNEINQNTGATDVYKRQGVYSGGRKKACQR